MRRLLVLLALGCRAQSVLTPDLEALTKIRMRMLFHLSHQPNYTCVETIERSSRSRSTNKLKVIDTLRLEVALVDGRETFGWPGAKKFEDSDVTKMVTSGAIGNGNFSSHAQSLFSGRSATFHYRGDADLQGRKSIRFDYVVPQMLSGYHIQIGKAGAIVGYHGSFYADPSTFDVQRIEVIADDLPSELMLAAASDKIDYALTRIGEGDFLLPAQSELSMIDLSGVESNNRVKFTSCREFSGESTISFDDAPSTKATAEPVPTRQFEVPANLAISLALTEDIDLNQAAIGDPVHTRVQSDVKQKGQVVIPKGAICTGRITRIEKNETYTMVGMEFPEIEAPGILARMKGTLDQTGGIPPMRSRVPMRGRSPQLPGEGVFPVPPSQRHLSKGCIMYWRS